MASGSAGSEMVKVSSSGQMEPGTRAPGKTIELTAKANLPISTVTFTMETG
jgi:hypothetical protein